MAADLKARGADVRGLYLFNSPHPGDAAFSASLDRLMGASRIQRFEYLDDPDFGKNPSYLALDFGPAESSSLGGFIGGGPVCRFLNDDMNAGAGAEGRIAGAGGSGGRHGANVAW